MKKQGLFVFLAIFVFVCVCQAKQEKMRDPFFLPVILQERVQKGVKKSSLRLQGIIQSGTIIGALIRNNKRTNVVFLGGGIDGYKVQEITLEAVTLAKDKKIKTLRPE